MALIVIDMGFVHDYAYQDCDYRIRTTFGRSVLLLQAAHKIASVVQSTPAIKLVRQCKPASSK